MLRATLLVALGAVLLLGCQVSGTNEEYEATTLVMPKGHAEDGREAFRDLGCVSCHQVTWDAEMGQPVSENPGPLLDDKLRRKTSGSVATSIIAPSHHIGEEYVQIADDALSPMGDFTKTMTVRQLIDVVEYLRTQGGTTVAMTDP
jgi:hypothetical protein